MKMVATSQRASDVLPASYVRSTSTKACTKSWVAVCASTVGMHVKGETPDQPSRRFAFQTLLVWWLLPVDCFSLVKTTCSAWRPRIHTSTPHTRTIDKATRLVSRWGTVTTPAPMPCPPFAGRARRWMRFAQSLNPTNGGLPTFSDPPRKVWQQNGSLGAVSRPASFSGTAPHNLLLFFALSPFSPSFACLLLPSM